MKNYQLILQIFDRAWEESDVIPLSRKFILPYLSQLLEMNSLQLILYSFKNLAQEEILPFLLCTPEIWESMKLSDWVIVIKEMSPRQKYSHFFPNKSYSDIIFFIKWLNLDVLQFILDLNEVTSEEQKKICSYCCRFYDSLVITEDDLEDLNGEVFTRIDVLNHYRDKLIAENIKLLPTYSDKISFKNHIENICQKHLND